MKWYSVNELLPKRDPDYSTLSVDVLIEYEYHEEIMYGVAFLGYSSGTWEFSNNDSSGVKVLRWAYIDTGESNKPKIDGE